MAQEDALARTLPDSDMNRIGNIEVARATKEAQSARKLQLSRDCAVGCTSTLALPVAKVRPNVLQHLIERLG